MITENIIKLLFKVNEVSFFCHYFKGNNFWDSIFDSPDEKPIILSGKNLLNSLSAKKQTTKFTSANFEKI